MNTNITRLAEDQFRVTSNGIDYEISRETTEPREWIAAIWGAADIEGIFPSFNTALASLEQSTPTSARP